MNKLESRDLQVLDEKTCRLVNAGTVGFLDAEEKALYYEMLAKMGIVVKIQVIN
jgi:hypothetical protein